MWKSQQPIIKTKPTVLNSVKRCSVKGYRQPCPSYKCHLTYGAVFGLSNRNFLTIWMEWSKSQNLYYVFWRSGYIQISNVTALTARPLPIVKLMSRSRSRSGEGQEGQIWTCAVPYFWFSPEERQVRSRISVVLGCSLWLRCWDPVLIQHDCL